MSNEIDFYEFEEIELTDLSNNTINNNSKNNYSNDSLFSLYESPSKKRNLLTFFSNDSYGNNEITSNEKNNNNDYNSIENNTNKNTKFYKNKFIKSFMIILNHILIQLSLISLLEPILYFNFILNIEEQLFYDQIEEIDNQLINKVIPDDLSNSIRNQPFYNLFIQFLIYEKRYIDNTYNKLYDNSISANSDNEKLLNKLFNKSLNLSIIIMSITFCYTIMIKYLYNKKISKMLVHHLCFIIFIGLYEIWFFLNVVSQYFPWNTEELIFDIFKCSWYHLTNKYPELESLEKNVTITC